MVPNIKMFLDIFPHKKTLFLYLCFGRLLNDFYLCLELSLMARFDVITYSVDDTQVVMAGVMADAQLVVWMMQRVHHLLMMMVHVGVMLEHHHVMMVMMRMVRMVSDNR